MDPASLPLTRSSGRITLVLNCVRMGQDLCVTLAGGDRPHLGAVALGQPYPSHQDPSRTSASTSTLTLLGHKEEALARDLADRLARTTGATVCVACGIHVDGITDQDLADIHELAEELARELLVNLRA